MPRSLIACLDRKRAEFGTKDSRKPRQYAIGPRLIPFDEQQSKRRPLSAGRAAEGSGTDGLPSGVSGRERPGPNHAEVVVRAILDNRSPSERVYLEGASASRRDANTGDAPEMRIATY